MQSIFSKSAPENPLTHGDRNPTLKLTPRELAVLLLIAEGYSNRQLAEDLGISQATAREHVSNALRKTGTRSRLGLVLFAVRSGIVSLYEPSQRSSPIPATRSFSPRSRKQESVA